MAFSILMRVFALMLLSGLGGCLRAQDPVAATDEANLRPLQLKDLQYTRLNQGVDRQPVSLDVAVVRFRPRQRATGLPQHVDLISAIHVADATYYRDLNQRFREYDAVLYELVAPEGTRVPHGGATGSSVSFLQRGMKQMLDLRFQLEDVDYSRKNLIHADLSPEEFADSMRDRGESWTGMFARVMAESIARDSKKVFDTSEKELFAALFARDRALRLKRIMAEQFADLETVLAMYQGDQGSTLVTVRNAKALKVLRREIGKGRQRIGIFYGAAHMQDMAERLVEDFDLVPVQVEWLLAWDLRAPREGRKPIGSHE